MELLGFEAFGIHPFLWFSSLIYLHEVSYLLGETMEKQLQGNKACIPHSLQGQTKGHAFPQAHGYIWKLTCESCIKEKLGVSVNLDVSIGSG